jgi:hypothetical protein
VELAASEDVRRVQLFFRGVTTNHSAVTLVPKTTSGFRGRKFASAPTWLKPFAPPPLPPVARALIAP